VKDDLSIANARASYIVLKRQHQALAILSALDGDNRTAPAVLLADWLGECGLSISVRDLDELLNRLASEGLLRLAENEKNLIVHLTALGIETACGVTRSDSVARPIPR
jgi:hypothetical protein